MNMSGGVGFNYCKSRHIVQVCTYVMARTIVGCQGVLTPSLLKECAIVQIAIKAIIIITIIICIIIIFSFSLPV